MNRQQAQDLVAKAKPHLNRTIHVHVTDDGFNVKQSIECEFVDWGALSMSEDGGEPVIQLTAKLVGKADGKLYPIPLAVVVREFESVDKKKGQP